MAEVVPAPRGPNWDSALRIVAAVCAVAFIAVLNFVPVAANDVWLQIKIGSMVWHDRVIPDTVLFTFTPLRDNAFNVHEWLPSVLLYLLQEALGREGLILVQGGVALLQGWLCYLLARRLSGSTGVALLLAMAAMLAANYRNQIRPEVFAILLMLAQLQVLAAFQASGRRGTLAWLVPIAIVWANTHGSFLLGPIIAAIFAAGEALQAFRRPPQGSPRAGLRSAWLAGRPFAFASLAMAAASLVNPMGLGLWHFALSFTQSKAARDFLIEWRPTLSAQFVASLPFWLFCGVAAATLATLVVRRRAVTPTGLLLLAAFGFLALQRNRYVVLFGFMALFVCAGLLRGGLRPGIERALLALVVATGITGSVLALRHGNVSGAYAYYTPSNRFSILMDERLSDATLEGNVFNSFELGAELIYKAYPRLVPSIDSRIDSYGDDYFLLHQRMLVSEQLLTRFVDEYEVKYLLLLHRDFESVKKMDQLRRQWRLKFMDHKMVLLERTRPLAAPRRP